MRSGDRRSRDAFAGGGPGQVLLVADRDEQPQRGEVDPPRFRMDGALVAHRFGIEDFKRHIAVECSAASGNYSKDARKVDLVPSERALSFLADAEQRTRLHSHSLRRRVEPMPTRHRYFVASSVTSLRNLANAA
jgi:hypothetical protein